MKILKKIKEKLTKWALKDMPLPQPIVFENYKFKILHAQRIVPYNEWNVARRFNSDDLEENLKFQIVKELLNQITINEEKTPEGVKYSCDLLYDIL